MPSTRPPATASATRRILRALVVDDRTDNRDLYSEYLRAHGWQVEDVTDGAEALAVAAFFAPKVIVMDVAMPEVDGIEATRRLRRDPRTSAIPVVVLTAYPEYEVAAFEAGCAAFLTKPCAPRELLETLLQVLADAERRSVPPAGQA